jgi:hypothetical protein
MMRPIGSPEQGEQGDPSAKSLKNNVNRRTGWGSVPCGECASRSERALARRPFPLSLYLFFYSVHPVLIVLQILRHRVTLILNRVEQGAGALECWEAEPARPPLPLAAATRGGGVKCSVRGRAHPCGAPPFSVRTKREGGS